MASKAKRRRRETKRVRLGKALRAELAPLVISHGFRNAPELWDRGMSPTPADHWVRRQGDYTDQIYLQWRKYGAPKFRICFATDRRARFPGHVTHGCVETGYRFGLDISWFGGWLRTIEATTRLASKRAADFLETGEWFRDVEP